MLSNKAAGPFSAQRGVQDFGPKKAKMPIFSVLRARPSISRAWRKRFAFLRNLNRGGSAAFRQGSRTEPVYHPCLAPSPGAGSGASGLHTGGSEGARSGPVYHLCLASFPGGREWSRQRVPFYRPRLASTPGGVRAPEVGPFTTRVWPPSPGAGSGRVRECPFTARVWPPHRGQ